MKHIKSLCSLLFLAVILMAGNNSFAANLPKMKDKYVTDAAGILSTSEQKQLREDVKSMCDYYSTRILVGIVPTFDGYDIEEYAGILSEHWNLDDENTMFILVKPKSENERGEAMLVTSSDLSDVFSLEVCDEIVQNEMIPYFKKDDYFGGIEAALEYMNNMSRGEDETTVAPTTIEKTPKTESKFMEFLSDVGVGIVTILKWGLIGLVALAMIGAISWFVRRKKEEQEEKSPRNPSVFSSKNDLDEISTAIADKKQEIEKRKREIEELNRLEQESQDLDDEYNSMRERNERNERTHRRDYDDCDDWGDFDDGNEDRNRRSSLNIEEVLEKMVEANEDKGKSILGRVGKVAIGVAGAAVVGKIVKKRREKDDDEGGLLSDIGSVFKKKDKAGKSSSGKPKLGGGGKPKASGKPKLGSGGGNKPKLGGNRSSGGW